MKSTTNEVAWSKGFKPQNKSGKPFGIQLGAHEMKLEASKATQGAESPEAGPIRKSYAAASMAARKPLHQPQTKKMERFGKLGGDNIEKRYKQRSAFRNIERERDDRDKERRHRKSKFDSIVKKKMEIEFMLKRSEGMRKSRADFGREDEEMFQGLIRSSKEGPIEKPILRREFDEKGFTTEWYQSLKKERAEKAKRYIERRKTSLDKSPNPWNASKTSPAWETEKPEALDLEQLSKMSLNMKDSAKSDEKGIELEDLAAKAKEFESQIKKRELDMPNFFKADVSKEGGKEDILNSALEEDVERPPEEEIGVEEGQGIGMMESTEEEIGMNSMRQSQKQNIDLIEREREEWLLKEQQRRREEEIRLQERERERWLQERRDYHQYQQQQQHYNPQQDQRFQQQQRQDPYLLHSHPQRHHQPPYNPQSRVSSNFGHGREKEKRFMDAVWFYRDPQRNIQGPFNSKTMRGWLEKDYFREDLSIARNSKNAPFVPLRQHFPDLSTAFLVDEVSLQQQQQHIMALRHQEQQMLMKERERRRMMEMEMRRREHERQAELERAAQMQQHVPIAQPSQPNLDFLDIPFTSKPPQTQSPPKTSSPPSPQAQISQEDFSREVKNEISSANLQQQEEKEKKVVPKEPKETKAQNLKKMLGVSVETKEKVVVNPWKKLNEGSKTNLKQIQAEETQQMKKDIANGTYAPHKNKLWANLVAKNANEGTYNTPLVYPQIPQNTVATPEEEKLLTWCKTTCHKLGIVFTKGFFELCLTEDRSAEVRKQFILKFGDLPEISKFASGFLTFKDKLRKG